MAENAYIKLVPGSGKETISLDEVKELFKYYQEITTKTGTQVDWGYESQAFPYEMKEAADSNGEWMYLQSVFDRYRVILLGIGQEKVVDDSENERIQSYVQITLPESSTYGDKGKANEFCKFLAKKLKAELHLFNKRVMYYYPRK
ncbi:DUF1885 family protein [Peribacillus cavernae]|uniref:DUF1885 family protein n=1 Tax=Peribacillus cavernae TaxID=1674310 RepID=A0A3S0VLH8_9BACI|nr:DUF1885 family protein [Peribacillus cavernae]MDQ0217244.1 hypothetical protein [Peribacillus cavernae]RUQ30286.1 DUF1885 family protein [Peribacillus cavernae]